MCSHKLFSKSMNSYLQHLVHVVILKCDKCGMYYTDFKRRKNVKSKHTDTNN